MRPSEALALSWVMSISTANRFQFLKAVIFGFEAATKTAASEREIKIVAKLQRP